MVSERGDASGRRRCAHLELRSTRELVDPGIIVSNKVRGSGRGPLQEVTSTRTEGNEFVKERKSQRRSKKRKDSESNSRAGAKRNHDFESKERVRK